jgi:ribokinase
MVRVLSAGHVNWDVTLRLDELPEPDGEARINSQSSGGGGSAANTAVALSSLGVDVGVIGSVGDDENGPLVRHELDERGVDLAGLRVVEGGTTTVKYLLIAADGSVAVLGNDGCNESVAPEDVDADRLDGVEHLHLTSQRPETARRLAELARAGDATVSFDPGRRLPHRDFSAALGLADLVFCNDREASIVAELDADLREDCTAVVKRGSEGASVLTPDETVHHEGFGVDPVDTSGSGDAFAAGFLTVWLDDGDLERCLAVGNACGALAAEQPGARTTLTQAAIHALLDDESSAQTDR